MKTIYHSTALTTLECCKCGGVIGLNSVWVANAQSVGHQKHQFWCPYCGTTQGWGGQSQHEKEVAALKKEQERLASALHWQEQRKQEAQREAEHFRRSRDGMKGVVSKIKKRVGRGVCPCCSRSFSDLRRHMECKHPEVAKGEVENPPA
jgi:hypothetical protein